MKNINKWVFSKKTNPKITILVSKMQPEIIKFKVCTRFNVITKPFSYFYDHYFVIKLKRVRYKFYISLLTILFESYLWEMDLSEYVVPLIRGCILLKYTFT